MTVKKRDVVSGATQLQTALFHLPPKSATGTQITRGRMVGVIWRGKILMLCEVPKTSVSAAERGWWWGCVCVLLCVHTLGVYSPV